MRKTGGVFSVLLVSDELNFHGIRYLSTFKGHTLRANHRKPLKNEYKARADRHHIHQENKLKIASFLQRNTYRPAATLRQIDRDWRFRIYNREIILELNKSAGQFHAIWSGKRTYGNHL